jgi:protein SCO1/2
MKKKALIFIIFVLIVTAYFIQSMEDSVEDALPAYGKAPTFSLLNTNSAPFVFSNADKRIKVVNFFFSRCPSICPAINGRLAEIFNSVSDESKEKVLFVSITVDPDYDTPEVLNGYAKEYRGAANNWEFLTGSQSIVQDLLDNGFKLASGMLPDDHNTRVVLIDSQGFIRGFYQGMENEQLNNLSKDLKLLLSE